MNRRNYFGIGISKNQIAEVNRHSDPTRLDKLSGEPLYVAKVMLPSSEFRNKSIDFGTDQNGIDRNKRGAYINVPASFIRDDRKQPEEKKYFYLNPERTYQVHFFGKAIEGKMLEDGRQVYDKPESVMLNASDLKTAFSFDREKINELNQNSNRNNDIPKTNEQVKTEKNSPDLKR